MLAPLSGDNANVQFYFKENLKHAVSKGSSLCGCVCVTWSVEMLLTGADLARSLQLQR